MSKNQPGTVEKKSSTIGPPAEIEPTPVSYLRSSVVIALHRHRKGVGSIPARGPVVDEFFSTVSGFWPKFVKCRLWQPKTVRNSTVR